MRYLTSGLAALLTTVLYACSSVVIEPEPVDRFAAGNYTYYKWRSKPLPPRPHSSDPYYALDPVMRREVDAQLAAKGYRLDPERAQFSVDYIYAVGLREGASPAQADNISPIPGVNPGRGVDQASVDNAIALGGVKETNNLLLQFNDAKSNQSVWQVTMSKIVEDSNRVNRTELEKNLRGHIREALEPLPNAP